MNKTIVKLKANKASETNQILNRMLKILRKTMPRKLIFLFQACINVEYYSKLFRKAKILTFKKKSGHTIFKIYRLIALLNTVIKMLKLIIIYRVTKLAKKNLLFSKLQINVKKKKSKRF